MNNESFDFDCLIDEPNTELFQRSLETHDKSRKRLMHPFSGSSKNGENDIIGGTNHKNLSDQELEDSFPYYTIKDEKYQYALTEHVEIFMKGCEISDLEFFVLSNTYFINDGKKLLEYYDRKRKDMVWTKENHLSFTKEYQHFVHLMIWISTRHEIPTDVVVHEIIPFMNEDYIFQEFNLEFKTFFLIAYMLNGFVSIEKIRKESFFFSINTSSWFLSLKDSKLPIDDYCNKNSFIGLKRNPKVESSLMNRLKGKQVLRNIFRIFCVFGELLSFLIRNTDNKEIIKKEINNCLIDFVDFFGRRIPKNGDETNFSKDDLFYFVKFIDLLGLLNVSDDNGVKIFENVSKKTITDFFYIFSIIKNVLFFSQKEKYLEIFEKELLQKNECYKERLFYFLENFLENIFVSKKANSFDLLGIDLKKFKKVKELIEKISSCFILSEKNDIKSIFFIFGNLNENEIQSFDFLKFCNALGEKINLEGNIEIMLDKKIKNNAIAREILRKHFFDKFNFFTSEKILDYNIDDTIELFLGESKIFSPEDILKEANFHKFFILFLKSMSTGRHFNLFKNFFIDNEKELKFDSTDYMQDYQREIKYSLERLFVDCDFKSINLLLELKKFKFFKLLFFGIAEHVFKNIKEILKNRKKSLRIIFKMFFGIKKKDNELIEKEREFVKIAFFLQDYYDIWEQSSKKNFVELLDGLNLFKKNFICFKILEVITRGNTNKDPNSIILKGLLDLVSSDEFSYSIMKKLKGKLHVLLETKDETIFPDFFELFKIKQSEEEMELIIKIFSELKKKIPLKNEIFQDKSMIGMLFSWIDDEEIIEEWKLKYVISAFLDVLKYFIENSENETGEMISIQTLEAFLFAYNIHIIEISEEIKGIILLTLNKINEHQFLELKKMDELKVFEKDFVKEKIKNRFSIIEPAEKTDFNFEINESMFQFNFDENTSDPEKQEGVFNFQTIITEEKTENENNELFVFK